MLHCSILCLLWGGVSTAQTYDSARYWVDAAFAPAADFYEITKTMDSYFMHNEDARIYSGFYKSYNRWADFWRTRLVAHPEHKGDIRYAAEMFSSVLAQLPEEDGNSALYSADWSSKGPGEFNQLQVKGLMESLAIDESDPSLQTIYACTNASGIWKTTNGGKYWQCVSDRSGFSNVGVQDIIINPNNPKIIYAATGLSTYGRSYGAGIIRSTNSGTSWSRINFPETNAIVKRLALKPGSSTHMVALYSQGRDFNSRENKIYISKNAGSNWELILNRDYLIVRYNLDKESLPAKLILYNAEGKPVLQQTLSRTVDELFMPVRHLNPGLYKIVIFGNKTMLLTSKFVIY